VKGFGLRCEATPFTEIVAEGDPKKLSTIDQ
jgi:hypothetical protein